MVGGPSTGGCIGTRIPVWMPVLHVASVGGLEFLAGCIGRYPKHVVQGLLGHAAPLYALDGGSTVLEPSKGKMVAANFITRLASRSSSRSKGTRSKMSHHSPPVTSANQR